MNRAEIWATIGRNVWCEKSFRGSKMALHSMCSQEAVNFSSWNKLFYRTVLANQLIWFPIPCFFILLQEWGLMWMGWSFSVYIICPGFGSDLTGQVHRLSNGTFTLAVFSCSCTKRFGLWSRSLGVNVSDLCGQPLPTFASKCTTPSVLHHSSRMKVNVQPV